MERTSKILIYEIKNKFSKRMIRFILLLLIFLLPTAYCLHPAFKDSGWGTRPCGMGGAFVAVADDANAPLWNPAGIKYLTRLEGNFMYAKLYAGLDEVDLGLNYLSFVYPNLKVGSLRIGSLGVSWGNFISKSLYREDTVTLTYAKGMDELIPLKGISVGINLKYLNHSYTLDKRTEDDPVFEAGNSKGSITVDIGTLVKFNIFNEDFSAGLSIKNITQPDVGLKTTDKVPLEWRTGLSYSMQNLSLLNINETIFAVDISLRDDDINPHFGCENWFLRKKLGFRFGANNREITTGFSYNKELFDKLGFQFDYAFIWPLEIKETWGSHRASISFRF
ncbi:MAG: type IX secretion system membrane protein PorP/SprF [Elusimicrobia bacterium]|nr:type IX secretion system membrane protein PorP/SprF [Elusimicrobiota bacterium]